MDLGIVEKILKPYLDEHHLELFDVELVKEFGYLILRVSVDVAKTNEKDSIDVDTLALVNEYLSSVIEKYDADMPEYMLEVCSPGAEKPLKNDEAITDSIGMYIHVEVPGMIYEGVLEANEEESITMKINMKGRFKKIKIEKSSIKLIRLAVKL